MLEDFKLKKLTDCKWINLFDVQYSRNNEETRSWLMCSRKEEPIKEAQAADAVVIIPIIKTEHGDKLVVTREFRVPIWDYEYACPAGLIDDGEDVETAVRRELKEETGLDLVEILHVSKPVYSSAGLSDESCHMIVVRAEGQISSDYLESTEDIEVILMSAQDIRELLKSDAQVAAKAWGLFYHFAAMGKIEWREL